MADITPPLTSASSASKKKSYSKLAAKQRTPVLYIRSVFFFLTLMLSHLSVSQMKKQDTSYLEEKQKSY